MHRIKLSEVNHNASLLTQSVLQASQMLGLYHAELARVLRLQCADIGDLANAKSVLTINTVAWIQAEKFIMLFEGLYVKFQGNEALMCNWLRKQNSLLQGVPLYLIVDDGRIDECLSVIMKSN